LHHIAELVFYCTVVSETFVFLQILSRMHITLLLYFPVSYHVCIARICMQGCMSAQTNYELNNVPPQMAIMWENQLPYSAPTAKNMQRYPNISAPETQPGQPQHTGGGYQQPQQPPMAQPVHNGNMNQPLMAQPQMVMITVPQGLQPGQALQVRHPTTGQLVLVNVPPGLQPGQQFTAQF
jgi:hypothetical protein